jgi:beta-N-acetylhexosaminidase
LVDAVLRSGRSTIVAALRLPYDLAAFPSVSTYLCTYSVLAPSMKALAAVLFGAARAEGKLPVTIPGI